MIANANTQNLMITSDLIVRLEEIRREMRNKNRINEEFTIRELEVMDLIAKGLNSYEIANTLFISKHTVDTHRKNIYKKGNFKGIRDVVLFCLFF